MPENETRFRGEVHLVSVGKWSFHSQLARNIFTRACTMKSEQNCTHTRHGVSAKRLNSPRDDSAVLGGLGEELVVPVAHRHLTSFAQQLRTRHLHEQQGVVNHRCI